MEATFSNWGPHGHLYPPPLWYEEEAEKTTEKSPHIIRSDSLGLKESRNSANRSKATATYHRLAVTIYTVDLAYTVDSGDTVYTVDTGMVYTVDMV